MANCLIRRISRSDRGATTMEYALLAGIFATSALVTIGETGRANRASLERSNSVLENGVRTDRNSSPRPQSDPGLAGSKASAGGSGDALLTWQSDFSIDDADQADTGNLKKIGPKKPSNAKGTGAPANKNSKKPE